MDADVEAKARAIADEAKKLRKPVPRSAWWAALVISAVSALALFIGYELHGDTVHETPIPGGTIPASSHTTISPYFGGQFFIGLVAGLAIGIVIGRTRKHD